MPVSFLPVHLHRSRPCHSSLPLPSLQPHLKQGPPAQLVFVGSHCGNSGSLGTLGSLFCPRKSAESQWAHGLNRWLSGRQQRRLPNVDSQPISCEPRKDAAEPDVGVTSPTHGAPSVLRFPLTPSLALDPDSAVPASRSHRARRTQLRPVSFCRLSLLPTIRCIRICFVWLGIERNFGCQV